MSQENVEVVRRGHAAFAEDGIEGAIPFFSEDLVIYAIPEWPDDAEYHGHAGLRKLTAEWTENFDDIGFDLHEVRSAGDAAVALFELTGRTKDGGVSLRQQVGGVFSDFKGGRIGQVRYFASWAQALKAAGLSE